MIVISGPSGVGKSSVVAGLRRRLPLEFSVSATTRPPRSGEVEGKDYHFLGEQAFDDMVVAGEFLEWAHYGGYRYGTPQRPVAELLAAGKDVVLDIEVQGAAQIKRSHPEATLVFLRPPTLAVLEQRLRGRGDTDEAAIARRLEIAAGELAAADDLFDHQVVNDDLDTAVTEVLGILSGPQRPDPSS